MKQKLHIILSILFAPLALIEYFVLLWFWAGDGAFMLVSVPVFFLLFLFGQLYFYKRCKEKRFIQKLLVYSMVFITPILAVFGSYAFAWLCGVEIVIW